MLGWLRARFRPRLPATSEPIERPVWAEELLAAIHKQSRANVKQAARFEAALAEQEAGIRALRSELERQRAPERDANARSAAAEYTALFDALDALDEAQRVVEEPHLAAGLSRVAERVLGFCERAGFRRVRSLGAAPDPRLLRIVGTEVGASVPPGHVSRMVCAAVLRGEQLVREGEVIVSAARREESQDGHVGN